jgi:Na+-transporting methylmalonyl-CoA/oxaloacetate decarboxylase gamma subunit
MTEIQQGLWITAVGMGLVFAVIIFLWGVMALLMWLTSRKRTSSEEQALPDLTGEPLLPELQTVEAQRRAAAAAVAVALALGTTRLGNQTAGYYEDGGALNPWLAAHRSRQIEQKKTRG